MSEPRPTPEQQARFDRVLEVFAWAAFLTWSWFAIDFTLRAFGL